MKYYVLSDDPEVYSDCPLDACPLLCVQHCMTMAIDCHYPTTPGKYVCPKKQPASPSIGMTAAKFYKESERGLTVHINRMKISVFMFFCIFFIGCDSRQTLETHEQSKGTAMDSIKEAGTEFTREELLQDYDQLWEDLEESYPFFPVLTQRGIDIPALKEYYRSMLTDRITDLEGFAVLLNNLFYDMDNLAHLSLMDAEFYYELLKLSEEERLGYTEEPWRSLLWNEQTRVSYALLRSEEETKEPVEILYPEVTMDYYEDLQVVYFKIPSFNHLLLKRDGDLIREYLEEHEDAKHVIFDIRGNRGGSDYYWKENLAAPFGGEYKWNRRLVLKESPLAEIFF